MLSDIFITMRFMWIDAFTTARLGGNPCPVVFDAEDLSGDQMLAITREFGQSETAFVMKSERADLRARYFTMEREIPLAGHPTIATIHAALVSGLISIPGDRGSINLELRDGPIKIEVKKDQNGFLITMYQRRPEFYETHDPFIVMPLFGLKPTDLMLGAKIQAVSTGTKQLMVPVSGLEALRRVQIQVDAYQQYRSQHDFFSPHLFCLQGVSRDAQTFARHPGVPPEPVEDPFTGSATGGMAAYLWHHGFLKAPDFIAEQGHWMNRPGRSWVRVVGPRDAIETVAVSGYAVELLRGEFLK